ncbi:MAG: T9SS type A sorting domain-containing protein [Ignavibacteria bacterium]|nr:T9SS type A sorting domain-containing protein [Ignavibacteria bacterium]
MKINLLLTIIFLSIIIYANIDEMNGIIGLTKKDGGVGCVCHDLNPTDSVIVWIEGPDSVLMNSTAQFRILITGGPAVAGGLNIDTYFGAVDSADTLTKVLFGELTHTLTNPYQDDTVSWNFLYTAPDSLVADTIYSVANSVNGDGNPTFDQWNFGENFIVHIYDNPVFVQSENLQPDDFVLYQNYPNPFNPSTNIGFRIADFGFVSLIVYDALGNEVVTLINKDLPAGEYEAEFSAKGGSASGGNAYHLTSGIYFYRLKAGSYVETKKMILMK